ncbi:MAG: sensor histidine kinase [Aquabacterium sp.]
MTLQTAALCGLLSQALLALLFGLVWRALQAQWAVLLGAGYVANALMYAFMFLGHVQVEMAAPPATAVALSAVVAIVLITAGVVDYVGLTAATARRLNIASIALAVVAVGIGLAGWMSRAVGLVVLALYVVGWAGLFLGAMRREPHSGHGIMVLALLAYPATVAAGLGGLIAPSLLGAAGVVPFAMLGATLLTTSVLRAQRRAALALAERENARQALQSANASLEQKVALRTAELRETIDGLESFNRSVSHDLRGPLGGIAGVSRLAAEAMDRGDLRTLQQLIPVIEDQALHSVELVDALLALARATDAVPQRAPVDVTAVAGQALALLPDVARESVPVQLEPMGSVHADAALLRQVFVNLIGNALKFSNGRPGAEVRVGARPAPGGPQFYVRDGGIGFDTQAAEGLFRPFQRLHGAAYEGTGVGLSIVKRIVEHHGGRVWAEGSPGRGATFWFSLGSA